MTSNIGSGLIQEKMEQLTDENREKVIESTRDEVFTVLKKTIRPEFINRVDEIIMFKPLTREEIKDIVSLQMERVKEMLSDNHISIELTPAAISWVAKAGFDPQFGARPLKRVIQRSILNRLSKEILSGKIQQNAKVLVDEKDGELVFKTE